MKIETKFNVGDKVIYDSSVYAIIQIGWTSDKPMPWYALDSNKSCRHANEDQLSPATRYSVGAKVWVMMHNNIYQVKIMTIIRPGRYKVYSDLLDTTFNEDELYPTKESLLASIQCYELA
jgi:hypothetical protein